MLVSCLLVSSLVSGFRPALPTRVQTVAATTPVSMSIAPAADRRDVLRALFTGAALTTLGAPAFADGDLDDLSAPSPEVRWQTRSPRDARSIAASKRV